MCPKVADREAAKDFITGDAPWMEPVDQFTVDTTDTHPAELITSDAEGLRKLVDRCADMMPDAHGVQALLTVPHTSVIVAEAERKLPLSYFFDGRQGFRLRDVAKWIRDEEVPFKLTDLARVLLDLHAAEAIDTEALYSDKQVIAKFGIAKEVLDAALARGKIKDGHTWANHSRITGAGLLAWIKSDSIPLRVDMATAAVVARKRRADAELAAEVKPIVESAEPTLADEAFGLLKARLRAEELDERENRGKMLDAYHAFLHGQGSLDAAALADLFCELGFSTEQVDADKALIKRADDLLALANRQRAAGKAVAQANEAKRQCKARHLVEEQECNKAVMLAYEEQGKATKAVVDRRELLASRPELFGLIDEEGI